MIYKMKNGVSACHVNPVNRVHFPSVSVDRINMIYKMEKLRLCLPCKSC